jgi:hypothetical protein
MQMPWGYWDEARCDHEYLGQDGCCLAELLLDKGGQGTGPQRLIV